MQICSLHTSMVVHMEWNAQQISLQLFVVDRFTKYLPNLEGNRSWDLMSGASASGGIRTAFSYCVQQIRNYDYHHYLSTFLNFPRTCGRLHLLSVLSILKQQEPRILLPIPKSALCALLWWREAIDKIFANKLIEHPTAQALSSARINDAKGEVIEILETIEELEWYAEDTVSTIFYMTLQAGGIKSTAADHAASHIGKASGLLLLFKSLPYRASRSCQFSYIPARVAAKHGLLVNQGGQMEISWTLASVCVMLLLRWHL
ncbi:unnamed protein product [Camellia sinensis]